MQILRAIKNNHFISSSFAALFISSLEIQLLCMFLIQCNSSIYGKIFHVLAFDSSLSIVVSANFIINLAQIIFLSISFCNSKTNEDQS